MSSTNTKLGIIIAIIAIAIILGVILALSYNNNDDVSQVTDGQCWSKAGGVGNLLKNSATRAECEELGGKSICNVGGSCDDLP